jgi:putative endonuclease
MGIEVSTICPNHPLRFRFGMAKLTRKKIFCKRGIGSKISESFWHLALMQQMTHPIAPISNWAVTQPHNQAIGRRGETVAAEWLAAKGFRILARNWRTGPLEVDLIALSGSEIIFLEVKTRQKGSNPKPEDAVRSRKKGHLIKAARVWWTLAETANAWDSLTPESRKQRNQALAALGLPTDFRLTDHHSLRFDVISVLLEAQGAKTVRHVPDAFQPQMATF